MSRKSQIVMIAGGLGFVLFAFSAYRGLGTYVERAGPVTRLADVKTLPPSLHHLKLMGPIQHAHIYAYRPNARRDIVVAKMEQADLAEFASRHGADKLKYWQQGDAYAARWVNQQVENVGLDMAVFGYRSEGDVIYTRIATDDASLEVYFCRQTQWIWMRIRRLGPGFEASD